MGIQHANLASTDYKGYGVSAASSPCWLDTEEQINTHRRILIYLYHHVQDRLGCAVPSCHNLLPRTSASLMNDTATSTTRMHEQAAS